MKRLRFRNMMPIAPLLLLSCGGGSGGAGGGSGGSATQSAIYVAPPAVPMVCNNPIPVSRIDARRLLQQSTFGWSESQLQSVMNNGFSCWVEYQLAYGSAYDSTIDAHKTHLERTIEISKMSDPLKHPDSVQNYVQGLSASPYSSTADNYVKRFQMAAWWENALDGHDQLRQRVAYALSQLEVVSTSEPPLDKHAEALAYYYDILARNAFGNFRTLLIEMAKSPAMGVFLSHQGNKKTDPVANIRPDENFAREVMQLFTVGLYMLNPDGTRKKDALGNPVPTYTQFDVEENARIMTGWDLVGNNRYGQTVSGNENYITPMEFTATQHETGVKTVLGQLVPDDGLGGDLTAVIDLLFNHPNTGPFISRHLISRLVTSNPSPAYVQRVAAVFANNGAGVRGDLKAVVRAILMDPEARGLSYTTNPNYGKVDEPLLAYSRFLKTFGVSRLNGWISRNNAVMNGVYWYSFPEKTFAQAPLRSSTVFNFYDSEFIPSDPYFSANKLIAPELQIQSIQMLANYNNAIWDVVNNNEKNAILEKYPSIQAFVATRRTYHKIFIISFDTELAVFETALDGDTNGDFINMKSVVVDAFGLTPRQNAIHALLQHLDQRMFAGAMPTAYYAILQTHLETIVNSASYKKWARLIVRDAVVLLASSSEFKVLK